jgi:hypothetical protein
MAGVSTAPRQFNPDLSSLNDPDVFDEILPTLPLRDHQKEDSRSFDAVGPLIRPLLVFIRNTAGSSTR